MASTFVKEISKHNGILLKICRAYHASLEDQDDLYQEIVLNAWQSYPRFEQRSKFSTWLYRVALNTALSQRRKNKFFGKMTNLDNIENKSFDGHVDERISMLNQVINRLEPLEKSLIVLYLDEIPYKEISEITGLTESNIGVKLNRIKIKMKKLLDSYGG